MSIVLTLTLTLTLVLEPRNVHREDVFGESVEEEGEI